MRLLGASNLIKAPVIPFLIPHLFLLPINIVSSFHTILNVIHSPHPLLRPLKTPTLRTPTLTSRATAKMSSYEYEEIVPGDIVAVRHGIKGRQEGLVVGSHVDYAVCLLGVLPEKKV